MKSLLISFWFLLVLALPLNGQSEHFLFEARISEYTSDSTATFNVLAPDWTKSYNGYTVRNYEAIVFDTSYHGKKWIIKYDSIAVAYPWSDHKTLVFPACQLMVYDQYDGDTGYHMITVPNWQGGFKTIRKKVRNYAYDTYEVRPQKRTYDGHYRSKKSIDAERKKGLWARDLARALQRDFTYELQYKHKYRNSRWVMEETFTNGPFRGMTLKQYMKRGGHTTGKYE